jgi:hypothetical protein
MWTKGSKEAKKSKEKQSENQVALKNLHPACMYICMYVHTYIQIFLRLLEYANRLGASWEMNSLLTVIITP